MPAKYHIELDMNQLRKNKKGQPIGNSIIRIPYVFSFVAFGHQNMYDEVMSGCK